LGKRQAKFKIVKFRPRIAFCICTNQSHLPKKGREGLKLVTWLKKKKWDTNYRLEITGLPFQIFRCSQKFSAGTTQKVTLHLLFVIGKQPILHVAMAMTRERAYREKGSL